MEHNSLADIGATCEIQKKKVIMSPQRTVNVDQSVRLLKLYWWFLEEGPEGVTFELPPAHHPWNPGGHS